MSAVVYSKPACGYCIRVKQVLKSKNVEYTEQIIDEDISKEDLESLLGVSIRTVPQVVINSEYIGGYTEVCNHYNIKAR